MSKKRMIEVYIGYTNGSGEPGQWQTDYVDIPADTPKRQIEKKAIEVTYSQLRRNKVENVAFVGLYNIPDPDEED